APRIRGCPGSCCRAPAAPPQVKNLSAQAGSLTEQRATAAAGLSARAAGRQHRPGDSGAHAASLRWAKAPRRCWRPPSDERSSPPPYPPSCPAPPTSPCQSERGGAVHRRDYLADTEGLIFDKHRPYLQSAHMHGNCNVKRNIISVFK